MSIEHRSDEAAAIKRRLTSGGTILVVGARSSNFSPELRAHPRVTIWDSTDPRTPTRTPPDNTKVIICTRFIAHKTFGRLQSFASKRRLLMMPGLNNTGEIKDVIAMALDMETETPRTPWASPAVDLRAHDLLPPPDEPPAPETPAAPPPRPGGRTMKAFIATIANLDASTDAEYNRIAPLIQQAGYTTTKLSVKQVIYILRREREGLPSYGQTAVTPKATPKSQPQPEVSHIADALRLIDEVSAGLGLLREACLKVQHDDEQMQATMQALRGFLNAPPSAATRS